MNVRNNLSYRNSFDVFCRAYEQDKIKIIRAFTFSEDQIRLSEAHKLKIYRSSFRNDLFHLWLEYRKIYDVEISIEGTRNGCGSRGRKAVDVTREALVGLFRGTIYGGYAGAYKGWGSSDNIDFFDAIKYYIYTGDYRSNLDKYVNEQFHNCDLKTIRVDVSFEDKDKDKDKDKKTQQPRSCRDRAFKPFKVVGGIIVGTTIGAVTGLFLGVTGKIGKMRKD